MLVFFSGVPLISGIAQLLTKVTNLKTVLKLTCADKYFFKQKVTFTKQVPITSKNKSPIPFSLKKFKFILTMIIHMLFSEQE